MRNRLFALMMISTASLLAADTKETAGTPSLGFAFKAANRELCAILGVPGAARWSDPLALPEGTTAARMAPGHRWALIGLESGEAGILQLDSMAYARLTDAAISDEEGVQFSPLGKAVALRAGGDGGVVTVWTGLPDAPSKVEATSQITGRFAISDDGTVALVAEGKLLRGASPVADCSDCVFAFFAGGNALAVVDSVQVVEIDEAGETRLIAQGLEAYDLVFATDKTVVLGGETKLQIVNRRTGVTTGEDMIAPVTRLEPMRLPGTLLLSSGEDGGASWMYSSDGVRFVPARAEVKE